MISRYMTTAEVAETLRLTPWQVLNLCREHKIPASKPAGKWLIAESDLVAYIESGANNAEPHGASA